uniref:Uncharacterized protein n=1 Tax=Kalanchoe fedtschenkoi TaxID=63787 RepID=A0A7N0TC61_KALFE
MLQILPQKTHESSQISYFYHITNYTFYILKYNLFFNIPLTQPIVTFYKSKLYFIIKNQTSTLESNCSRHSIASGETGDVSGCFVRRESHRRRL